MIDRIAAQAARIAATIQPAAGVGAAGRPGTAGVDPTSGLSFGDTLTQAINGVSAAQDGAQEIIGRFLRGEPVEMHQVMAAQEEAGLQLQMLVETRNKVLDATRTLLAIQV